MSLKGEKLYFYISYVIHINKFSTLGNDKSVDKDHTSTKVYSL